MLRCTFLHTRESKSSQDTFHNHKKGLVFNETPNTCWYTINHNTSQFSPKFQHWLFCTEMDTVIILNTILINNWAYFKNMKCKCICDICNTLYVFFSFKILCISSKFEVRLYFYLFLFYYFLSFISLRSNF
jgi:hypothetical protein